MTTTKPVQLLKYTGSKTRVMDALSPYLDGYDWILDPMCGSGSVSYGALHRGLVGSAWMNDANLWVHALHYAVKTRALSVRDELLKMPTEGIMASTYYLVRDDLNEAGPDATPLMAARLLWLNRNGFNGLMRQNKKGRINVSWCHRSTWNPQPTLDALGMVAMVADKTHMLGQSRGFSSCPTTLARSVAYFDPPYLGTHSSYTPDGFDEATHRKLAAFVGGLVSSGIDVVVSHSDTPEARAIYGSVPGLRVSVLDAATFRSVSRGKRGTAGEIVFHSREPK